MNITPGWGIVIMMNNYLHDVATAVLLGSAFILWILVRLTKDHNDPAAIRFFLAAYQKFTLMVRASIAWIILGGIPRTIFYMDFEWANAAGKNQIPALIIKHIVITICVIGGGIAWVRLKKRADLLRKELG